MFCRQCGATLPDGAVFCPQCGTPVGQVRKGDNGKPAILIILLAAVLPVIIIFVIGLLAAIAVPNFVRPRNNAQRNACIDNLRMLEGAIEQVKLEGGIPSSDTIYGPDNYIKVAPTCPSTKAAYAIPEDGSRPVCPNPTVNGTGDHERHELPSH